MLLYENKQKKNGKPSIAIFTMKVRHTIYSWRMDRKPSFYPVQTRSHLHWPDTKEELGKDYKRITLFLCPEFDFQTSEGNFDELHLSDFADDDSDVPSSCNKRQKREVEPTCSSDHNSSTQCDQQLEKTHKLECDDQLIQDQKCESGQCQHQPVDLAQQLEEDEQLALDLQRCYDEADIITPEDDNCTTISDSSSVVASLGRQVDQSSHVFIVVRRGAPLERVLSIWSREVKKNTGNAKNIVRVHFSGEQGIDSGALAKEFFTMTLPNIASVIFPKGQPVDSTFHVYNGNFKACGEIVAASIAQGGPAPCFLEESVYGLMADPNVPLQQLDTERHLTTSDMVLLNAIKDDVIAHTDSIDYTGTIDTSRIEEILSSVAISLVTKRLVYLKEFLNGLDSYGMTAIIQNHPEACKPLFVKNAQKNNVVDANYLFSVLHPEHAEEGSSRRKVEESVMDLLQDFLFHLEDDPNVNCPGYAETVASCEDTGKEAEESKEELLLPDLTPAGVMGWLTGQKHKPISGEQISITVKFDHDCLIRNPKHQICFPVVGACAKEITFPVAHMTTEKSFNEIFMLALSKGQSFGMA